MGCDLYIWIYNDDKQILQNKMRPEIYVSNFSNLSQEAFDLPVAQIFQPC